MLWSGAAEKGGIDGELVGWGGLAARKTLSQQINEGNTKLADFLTQNDDHDDGDIGDSLNMFCLVFWWSDLILTWFDDIVETVVMDDNLIVFALIWWSDLILTWFDDIVETVVMTFEREEQRAEGLFYFPAKVSRWTGR